MKQDESSLVERRDVERVKRWADRWYRNASSRGPDLTDKEFRQTTCDGLRFASRLQESDRVPDPHQHEVDALCRSMEVEWGTFAGDDRNPASFGQSCRRRGDLS
jgi:hypothetical protein